MSPLDRKLLRDLWRMKGQAIAIAIVIGVGVMMLVMMTGLLTSLEQTRRAYYERYRMTDIFASVTRAPDRLLADLAAIPGVSAIQGRVTGNALIDLPGQELPLQAMAVSLPDIGVPRLNDIYLSAGRRLDSDRSDEILLLQGFADAHGLRPGDTLRATMYGARRVFRIVGLAQAPEFLCATAPGELAPDDSRFGVIWMSRTALAAAYDMDGAFNQALLSIGRGIDKAAVLGAVDRILDRYGGLGAYGLEDHASDRFLSDDISGLRAMSTVVPPIFLAVAAFLLYIVISRMVQAEREQIGLMKAFGYSNAEVGGHYVKFVLAVAAGGALLGCLAGIAAGRGFTGFYIQYFKFPFLVFQLDPASFVVGFGVSILAASAGGVIVLRGVFALTPAVAMSPPTPPDYGRSGSLGLWLSSLLDQPSRMVLRRLMRQPWRMAGAVAGIAAGMALSVGMVSILSGFDRTLTLAFDVIDRSDLTVSFTEAMSDKTILELQRMPGVIEVEPVRIVPVVLRNGLQSYRGSINGLVPDARLSRALGKELQAIPMREEGVILATALSGILTIAPGETLTAEVREGRQPMVDIPVVDIAETLLGSPAYMKLGSLNRAMGEPNRVSGAYLRVDAAQSAHVYRELKNMPTVASVSLKADVRAAFQKLMDAGAGAMRYIMVAIAAVITFGVVYNAARIAYAERARDLASLRVIGFTSGEVAFVLLGEIAAVTLIALPIGSLLGYQLTFAIAAGFSSDLYQIPAQVDLENYGTAALAVVGAAVISGWLVKRDMDREDLIAALKTRE